MNTKYSLIKKKNYNYYYIIILLIIIIIIYYLYNNTKLYETFTYNLGICSRNCCATQWYVPNSIREQNDINPDNYNSDLIRSNMTCNDGIKNAGCICLTKESKELLTNRGNDKLSFGNGLLNKDNNMSAMNNFIDNKLPINSNFLQ